MLDLLMPKPRAAIDSGTGIWYSNRVKSLAGVVVDSEIALTYAALWCAFRVICEAESTLDLPTYERGADGDRREAPEQPSYDLLNSAPNVLMGAMPFRYGVTLGQVGVGNGFADIERDELNRPMALWPIHPGRVKAPWPGATDERGRPVPPQDYLVRNDDGTYVHVEAQDMLHVPGCFPEDGRWGKGCVTYHREQIGAALGADRVSAVQFGAGNVPRVGVIDPRLKDKEQRREFRREWKEIHGSPDSGEIAILTHPEAKIIPLSINSRDAQFLEGRKFSKEEIATICRVPLHMLKTRSGEPRANVEQMGIEFVIYDLLPWLRAWEAQANLKLFRRADRGRFFVAHRVERLIRGDMQARYNAYKTAIMAGFMTVNEARRLENLPGIGPDGDQYLVPMNMTTLKAMRQGKPPPGQPTGGRGIGSDQSGQPGDGGGDTEARGPAAGQLQALAGSMRAGHRGAMLPAPAGCGGPGSGVPGPCPEGGQAGAAPGGGADVADATTDESHEERHGREEKDLAAQHDAEKEAAPDEDAYHEKLDAQQDKEYDELQERHASETTEHEKLDGRQDKESDAQVRQQDKDEKTLDRQHSKETKGLERQQEREAKTLDRDRDKASADLEREREKDGERIDAERAKEDAKNGPPSQETQTRREQEDREWHEKNDREDDAFANEWNGKQEAMEARHEKEENALLEKQSKEYQERVDLHAAQEKELKARHESQRRSLDERQKQDAVAQRQRWNEERAALGLRTLPAAPGAAQPTGQAAADAPTAAARAVLADALARLFRKEAKAALANAKRPDFDAWLEGFYARHQPTLAEGLAPACGLLRALGKPADPADLARQITADAVGRLRGAYDTMTPAGFAALLAGWAAGRAGGWADQILA
jgi:HK97 family phage portal protein